MRPGWKGSSLGVKKSTKKSQQHEENGQPSRRRRLQGGGPTGIKAPGRVASGVKTPRGDGDESLRDW